MLLAEAIRQAGVQATGKSRDQDRGLIRDWLTLQTNSTQAVAGLTGPIFFDETRSLPGPIRIGRCVEGQMISAPVQLEAVSNPALIDLDGELASGHIIRIRQRFYWLQRVVYTGNRYQSDQPHRSKQGDLHLRLLPVIPLLRRQCS